MAGVKARQGAAIAGRRRRPVALRFVARLAALAMTGDHAATGGARQGQGSPAQCRQGQQQGADNYHPLQGLMPPHAFHT